MKKPYYKKKQQGITGLGTRTVFNNLFEAPFNPNQTKKYYAVIKLKDQSYLTTYNARFRSEAVAIFDEEARLSSGQVETIGVFK